MSEACRQFQPTIWNFPIVQCPPSTTSRLRITGAQRLAAELLAVFSAKRCAAEALAADEADMAELEEIENATKRRKKAGEDA